MKTSILNHKEIEFLFQTVNLKHHKPILDHFQHQID